MGLHSEVLGSVLEHSHSIIHMYINSHKWRDHRLEASGQGCVEPKSPGQGMAVRRKWGLWDAEFFKRNLQIQAFLVNFLKLNKMPNSHLRSFFKKVLSPQIHFQAASGLWIAGLQALCIEVVKFHERNCEVSEID